MAEKFNMADFFQEISRFFGSKTTMICYVMLNVLLCYVMLCYVMTISGIQTHYLSCPPVSIIHPLKGPLVLPPGKSGAFKHAVSLINR
jgi:hypothetical protein